MGELISVLVTEFVSSVIQWFAPRWVRAGCALLGLLGFVLLFGMFVWDLVLF